MQRHRYQEFIHFLNAIEAELPADKTVHVILDNYATHKQPKARAWLARNPRWTFHTSCSWLNAVEGFFAKPTRRRLQTTCSTRSSICKRPSIASLSNITGTRDLSSGRLSPTRLLQPATACTKRWKQSTSEHQQHFWLQLEMVGCAIHLALFCVPHDYLYLTIYVQTVSALLSK